MDFTYNFKDELKITTRPSRLKKADESRTKDETTEKSANGDQPDESLYSQKFENDSNNRLTNTKKEAEKHEKAEKESWEGSKGRRYSEIEDDYNDEIGQVDERDDSDEFPDDFRDNDLDELDLEISNKEMQHIERIRMEESFRSTMKKEKQRLQRVSKNGDSKEEKQEQRIPFGVDEANSAGGLGLLPLVS